MISKLHWTKNITVIIIIIFICSLILRILGTPGTWASLFTFYGFFGSIFWSFINTLLMYKEINIKSKFNVYWLFFSGIPFLYFLISCLLLFLEINLP